MRVISAIFMLEFLANGVKTTETASAQERLLDADHGKSKSFISLYSGKTSRGRSDSSAGGRPRVVMGSGAKFAVSLKIRIDCA